ncbi:hypothetical protein O988_05832 [Pseudogymnoascus sp. VKM F-3808]|nr:hypothetical protein O988_05832 [Pseudogymnoascus sp. VKM F-3808]
MAAFKSVNEAQTPGPSMNQEETTPATTEPNPGPGAAGPSTSKIDEAKTPTKSSFAALPSHSDSNAGEPPSTANTSEFKKAAKRESSQYSTNSRDSEDVDMDGTDGDDDGSDVDSVAADGTRSTKKKKSQRFFCTEYPPCNLSFTRSEHLARHIRKHTGERPFQCHCSRRFSRLDNLRQHAQTVHVNEEIPGDSLAASSTRFQRQIRSDRVRPLGNRARASTSSAQPGQLRGHTRNSLSASSIGSIYGGREDARRRPAPLIMAGDPRSRGSFDGYGSTEGHYVSSGFVNSGFNTPTSSRYSGGYDSSQWGSAMGSPIHGHSRTASMYADRRIPGRRLSVPSTENPFGSQGFGPSSYNPPTLAPLSSGSQESFSPSGSTLASPTSSIASWSRRESLASAADDYRRRTWHHPESQPGFTSRLQSVMAPASQRPNPPQTNPSAPSGQVTLPGIESFLSRPVTPPPRNPSPMVVDTPTRSEYPWSDERPAAAAAQWDSNLSRNFTRLEVAQQTSRPDDASAWATDATRAVQERAAQQSQVSPRPQPRVSFSNTPSYPAQEPPSRHPSHHISAPPLTPRDTRRQGWYAGPLPARQRPSPEGGSSSSDNGVPGTPQMTGQGDYGPVIVQQSSGSWDERDREGQRTAEQGGQMRGGHLHQEHVREGSGASQGQEFNGRIPAAIGQAYAAYGAVTLPPAAEAVKADDGMMRLEALVAVATGERDNTAAAAF